MKRLGFLFFAWCLLGALLAARSEAAPVCPDAKYRPLALTSVESAGGIGGTGRAAESGAGGIGGTGIVGTITGFASICVNGLEVHYDRNVPVTANGRPVDTQQLAIGQQVVVEAVDSERGLEAARISIVYKLEGPVTRAGRGVQLEVMGAPVITSELTHRLPALRAGDWVQVSGHADAQGRVYATRLVLAQRQADVSVVGEGRPASRRVGAVMIDQRAEGDVLVRGRWDGYRLRVSDVRPAPAVDWSKRPERLVVETRVREVSGANVRTGRAEIDNLLVGRSELKPGDMVRVTSKREADGQLRPEKLERAERHGTGRSEGGGGRSGREARPAEKRDAPPPVQRDERNGRSSREDRAERQERAERRERPERRDARVRDRDSERTSRG